MGKGQHRMPTKDELVQRYNRMNTIPQVMLDPDKNKGHLFLQSSFTLTDWCRAVAYLVS